MEDIVAHGIAEMEALMDKGIAKMEQIVAEGIAKIEHLVATRSSTMESPLTEQTVPEDAPLIRVSAVSHPFRSKINWTPQELKSLDDVMSSFRVPFKALKYADVHTKLADIHPTVGKHKLDLAMRSLKTGEERLSEEASRKQNSKPENKIVKAPEKAIGFSEDLPEEDQATNKIGSSAGLVNLGNTCYMNSTLQCLKSVPELKSALSNYSRTGRSNDVDQASHMLTVATRELFGDLDRSVNAVSPTQFWMALREKFPQFSQLHNGMYMHQDAEECWRQLLCTLSQSLKAPSSSEDADAVKALFGVNLMSRLHCQESGEKSSETESEYFLKCHISHEVNHLHEGLKHGLKGELEKTSPALGRNALYLKESLIDSLPRYLTVQFVRFFWKRETNQKAKILRKVDYPLELDIYDLCSEDLRKKLEAPRQKLRDEEGKKFGVKTNAESSSKDTGVKMTDAEASSNGSGESSTVAQPEGASSEKETHMTGIYDLVSVLTHKGSSADSGHYLSWVKQDSGKWIQYDDSYPSLQREEDITKLSGGGDLAYIVMYKARFV